MFPVFWKGVIKYQTTPLHLAKVKHCCPGDHVSLMGKNTVHLGIHQQLHFQLPQSSWQRSSTDKGTWMYYSSVIHNGQNKHGLDVLFLNISHSPKDSLPPLITYAQNPQVLPRASVEKQSTEACKCILPPMKSTVERMKLHSRGPYLTNIRWLIILFYFY